MEHNNYKIILIIFLALPNGDDSFLLTAFTNKEISKIWIDNLMKQDGNRPNWEINISIERY
jgi:hypothetical protein